jgi:peptide/nickel transport system permease protein
MFGYLVRKGVHTLFVAFGVVTLMFIALRLSGDPAATMLPGDATVDEVAALRRTLGLDRPFPEVIIYGVNTRVALEPRPDHRLIAAEMSVTR